MDELCTIAETGATYKHYDAVGRAAVPCEGYEDSQADLLQSLALELYISCNAWCVYDYASSGELAWNWNNNDLCWNLLEWGACHFDYTNNVNSREWEIMKERINAFCTLSPTISFPTMAPSCIPHQEWSADLMDELCTIAESGATYKHHEAVDRAAVPCEGHEDSEANLLESLALELYQSCSAWCVYDYASGGDLAWSWNNADLCWDLLHWGGCHFDYTNKVNNSEWELAKERISAICSISPTVLPTISSPTSTPTTCVPYYHWSQERATELCSDSAYGQADKSFGASVCSDADSNTKQELLEETLANQFYRTCSSWCLYNYQTLIKNVQLGSNDQAGFIWNNSDTCWKWVTTGHACFTSHENEFEEIMSFAGANCLAQAF